MGSSILERVRLGLEETKGRWPEVAKQSGVPYPTIKSIVQGLSKSPRIDTLEKLDAYFEEIRRSAA